MEIHIEVFRGKNIMSSTDTQIIQEKLHIHICTCKERDKMMW